MAEGAMRDSKHEKDSLTFAGTERGSRAPNGERLLKANSDSMLIASKEMGATILYSQGTTDLCNILNELGSGFFPRASR